MPRGRRGQSQSGSSSSYSSGHASYILDKMISERRISPGELNRYVGDMHREIGDLEKRLASLRAAAGSAGASAGRSGGGSSSGSSAQASSAPRRRGRPPGSGSKGKSSSAGASSSSASQSSGSGAGAKAGGARKRRSSITPEQLASRQLQGRYLGLIRQIPANKRGNYQRIAKEKGREAAIREMQDNLKK